VLEGPTLWASVGYFRATISAQLAEEGKFSQMTAN
jgi:hypothetical protein